MQRSFLFDRTLAALARRAFPAGHPWRHSLFLRTADCLPPHRPFWSYEDFQLLTRIFLARRYGSPINSEAFLIAVHFQALCLKRSSPRRKVMLTVRLFMVFYKVHVLTHNFEP
ncbi:hypothetical protein D918_04331 [Trichuris suis]|nr:hypothetical protein D918_04331 [Trichuris suis]